MTEVIKKTIPFNYVARDYQKPFWDAMRSGKKRAVLVWHRRSGKDKTLVNFVAKEMAKRVGSYYYLFPTYNQGRKILWEGMDRDGFKFLDHFPMEALKGKPNDTEMKLEYANGSLFRVIGTDKIDSIVGTNPVGCVFSEYSLQDPAAWDYLRPILAENGGWAVFNFTPRGENHGCQLYEMAKDDPAWFCQVLTVEDTKVIAPEVLEQERREIIAKDGNDALYQQEYMCSFKVPIAGAYYAAQLMIAEQEKRICSVPYERAVPVDTWWDLGIDDSMTIWFTQTVGREIRVIDYVEVSGEGLVHCAGILREKGYVYGNHTAPHDIEVRELSTGKSRLETARNFGINFRVAPRLGVDDGIDAARNIFSRCWFDAKKCQRGLNALKSYHKAFDEKNKCFRNHPHHDWSSHGADGFRTLAVAFRDTSPTIEVVTPAFQSSNRWGKLRKEL
jgi:phage terminase large subunit